MKDIINITIEDLSQTDNTLLAYMDFGKKKYFYIFSCAMHQLSSLLAITTHNHNKFHEKI